MTVYTYDQLKALWQQAGGSVLAAPMAAAVAMAESAGNSEATNNNSNGTIDRGLWQINSVHGGLSTLDPLANARAAVQISNNGTTWRPWCSAWSDNRCGGTFLGAGANALKFLPPGSSAGSTPTGNTGTAVSTPFDPLDPYGSGQRLGKSLRDASIGDLFSPIFRSVWYGAMTGLGVVLTGVGVWLLIQNSAFGQTVRGIAGRYIGRDRSDSSADSSVSTEELEGGDDE